MLVCLVFVEKNSLEDRFIRSVGKLALFLIIHIWSEDHQLLKVVVYFACQNS